MWCTVHTSRCGGGGSATPPEEKKTNWNFKGIDGLRAKTIRCFFGHSLKWCCFLPSMVRWLFGSDARPYGELFSKSFFCGWIIHWAPVTVRQQYTTWYTWPTAHDCYGLVCFFFSLFFVCFVTVAPDRSTVRSHQIMNEWRAHGELIFDEVVYLDFCPLIYATV